MNMPNLDNYEFLHGTASKLVRMPEGVEPVVITVRDGAVIQAVTLSTFVEKCAMVIRLVQNNYEAEQEVVDVCRRNVFYVGQMLNVLEDLLQ